MSALSVQPTFPIFTDIDGQPLEAGSIYIGIAGLNPITNPKTVYWNAALTQVATQPILTRGGYPLNGSAVGRLYVAGDYSIAVANRIGSVVYSSLTPTERYDSSVLTFLQAGAGAQPRSVQSKLRDVVSVKDFGAVGDGVTDDTAAIQAAAAVSAPYFAPTGIYTSSAANSSFLTGKQNGIGQIKTADNNLSAPYFSVVDTAPSSFGNETSPLTAFNGDLSRCQFPISHTVTGAATLGQPTTGYLYRPEAMPHYTYLYNASGWNQSTASNIGRTGIAAYRTKVFQTGQGDAVCYNGSVFVNSTRSGSTDFLANPAGVLFNGDMEAGADGVYLNPYETLCLDNGYDAACAGIVNNFVRTNATGAKSAVWQGYRAQNTGSATCDALISATGKWVTGLDLAMSILDFGATKAAISLKANDRIYFNNAATALGNLNANFRTTVFNLDYVEYNSALSAFNFVQNNSSRLQVGATVVVNTDFLISIASVGNYANDAAAAAAGVPVGGVYRNGSVLQIRVT